MKMRGVLFGSAGLGLLAFVVGMIVRRMVVKTRMPGPARYDGFVGEEFIG